MGRKLNTKSMKILKNDNNKTSPSEQLYALRQSVDNSTLKQFSIAVGGSDSSLVDIIIIGGIKLKEQFEVTLKTSRNSFRRTFSGYGRLFFNFSDKQSSAIYFFPVLFLLSEIYFFNTEHILKIFTTDVNIKYCVEVVINLMLSSKSTSHQKAHCFIFQLSGPPKFDNVVFNKNNNGFKVYLSSYPLPSINITLDDGSGKKKLLSVTHQLQNGTSHVYKGAYPTKYPCTTKIHLLASLYETRLMKSIELPSMCILNKHATFF